MSVQRLSAFSDGDKGGNPAGIYISDGHPVEEEMRSIAADVGYSETAFAEPIDGGWRVRYFSPETEVPFCGHATIALGAALAEKIGAGVYALKLNQTDITVEGFKENNSYAAALQSPLTQSRPADPEEVATAIKLFGYIEDDLATNMPVSRANAGAEHLIIGLKSRDALSAMSYSLSDGREFMRQAGLVTVMLVYAESRQFFHSRNPFASGGVYEDPATGAASAAFAGYLRDIGWPHRGEINLVQGEDMGARSLINAKFSHIPGSSVRISGMVRFMAI